MEYKLSNVLERRRCERVIDACIDICDLGFGEYVRELLEVVNRQLCEVLDKEGE